MNNQDRAKYYLRFWYNSAIKYPENFAMSFDDLVAYIAKTKPTWFNDWGNACLIAEQSRGTDVVAASLQDLAHTAQGKVSQYPDGSFKGNEFFDVLYSKVANWDLKRIGTAVTEISSQGVKAVAEVGSFALNSYILAGAVGFGVGVYFLLKNWKVRA